MEKLSAFQHSSSSVVQHSSLKSFGLGIMENHRVVFNLWVWNHWKALYLVFNFVAWSHWNEINLVFNILAWNHWNALRFFNILGWHHWKALCFSTFELWIIETHCGFQHLAQNIVIITQFDWNKATSNLDGGATPETQLWERLCIVGPAMFDSRT